MDRVGLQAANVARHIEGEHLPTSVSGELHRAEHAAHDQKEVLRRIAFAHDLLAGLERNDQGVEVRKTRGEQLTDPWRAVHVMVERICHPPTRLLTTRRAPRDCDPLDLFVYPPLQCNIGARPLPKEHGVLTQPLGRPRGSNGFGGASAG